MSNETTSTLVLAGFIFLFLAVLFLILREVVCWYFKINERVDLMEKQNKLLEQLLKKDESQKEETPIVTKI